MSTYSEVKDITDARLFLRNHVYDNTIDLFREALESNEDIIVNNFSYDIPTKSIVLISPSFDVDYDAINTSFINYLRNKEVLDIINSSSISTELLNDLASKICSGIVKTLYDIKHICNGGINTIFINL